MDRAIVEIMILTALLGLSVTAVSIFAVQYSDLSSWMQSIETSRAVLAASSSIANAEADAMSAGGHSSCLLIFPTTITMNASRNSLAVSVPGAPLEVLTFPLKLNVEGDGSGRVFNITAFSNGTIFIYPG